MGRAWRDTLLAHNGLAGDRERDAEPVSAWSRRRQHGWLMSEPCNPAGPYASAETEYWYNVMRQADMPVAGIIELDFDVPRVSRLFARASVMRPEEAKALVASELLADVALFGDLRQILGLTDKRAYLELSYLASRTPHPSRAAGLCGCRPWTMARHVMIFFTNMLRSHDAEVRDAAAGLMAQYLLDEGLLVAAQGFAGLTAADLGAIYRTLIVPRENQQKAAKRRGHGCEGALAGVLVACGVKMLPLDKYRNPMGSTDPNLDLETLEVRRKERGNTYSFDMLVLDSADRVRVAIQSLIHTSDPGQYGVNKSDETVAVARRFKAVNSTRPPESRIELWGLFDGIGFSENKPDTLNKMLAHVDWFVQGNTLYKAPLRLHELGLLRVKAVQLSSVYSAEDIECIRHRYIPNDVLVLGEGDCPQADWTAVPAGRASIFL